jgi:DNA repair protein RadA/Sms
LTRCENCGARVDGAPEYCPACGAFSTLLPFALEAPPNLPNLALDAADIDEGPTHHISTGFEPWDEVLGGGLVLGSSLILYGGPGARKTTWAGAIAKRVAHARRGRAIHLCPEMPRAQVRDAVARVLDPAGLFILGADQDAYKLDACLAEVLRLRPRVVVYDSIQSFEAGGLAGSEAAVKRTVELARRFAVQYQHAAILISQVNQAGLPSGPWRTIHDCDVVAHLEFSKVTIQNKNRYAPTPREAALP